MKSPLVKTFAEWVYWAVAAFLLFEGAVYSFFFWWDYLVARIDGPWQSVFAGPALGLFPASVIVALLPIALWDMRYIWPVLSGAHSVLILINLTFALWLYRSRKVPLRLRATALAGMIILGFAPRVVSDLLIS